MVWEITVAGVYKDLHDFGGTVTKADGTVGMDGLEPTAGVTIDLAGDVYGTTSGGGTYGGTIGVGQGGVVWVITTSGAYIDLHDFGGNVVN